MEKINDYCQAKVFDALWNDNLLDNNMNSCVVMLERFCPRIYENVDW